MTRSIEETIDCRSGIDDFLSQEFRDAPALWHSPGGSADRRGDDSSTITAVVALPSDSDCSETIAKAKDYAAAKVACYTAARKVMPALLEIAKGQNTDSDYANELTEIFRGFGEDNCITRIAVTSEEQAEDQNGDNRMMGQRYTVPYALHQMHGFINPYLAEQSGFSDADLELFWEALTNMVELNRSAGRGLMSVRKLIVFEHESKLGNAPAHTLFELVKVNQAH